jgi:predicted dehydrogenase
MKFLIIGLGDMGKRRIRSLFSLKIKPSYIFGYDIREDRRAEVKKEHGINIVKEPDDCIKEVDIIIISTPPDKHLIYEKYAIKNGKDFFCEAGMIEEGLLEVGKLVKKKNIKAYFSNTSRFLVEKKIIKDLLKSGHVGKPLSFYYHSGSFLPYWHTFEDINDFYVSKEKTGAAREMVVFELGWLRWVFGEVKKVFCIKEKLSSEINADIDDTYNILFVFESGVYGNLLIDVITKPYSEIIEIVCSNGTIYYNHFNRCVKTIKDIGKGHNYDKWEIHQMDSENKYGNYPRGEDFYIDEFKDFLNYINGKIEFDYLNTYKDELDSIKVLKAAEESAIKGKIIDIS